jgi:hypothetical protein
MAQDWTAKEVELIVYDYFVMLQEELRGNFYSKKDHKIALRALLVNRSEGSIEFKHQNVSAVLAERGEPFIQGYKPRTNYQQLLKDMVVSYREQHTSDLDPLFEAFAQEVLPITPVSIIDYATCLAPAPPRSKVSPKIINFRPAKVNYLEKEQNNRSLGAAGEQFVIEFEKWRLKEVGRSDLASLIEWTSKIKGDGAGYDILSKNEDGSDRYIEVKTTKLSKETPIYLTSTEFAFAAQNASNFYLYRVFHFVTGKQLFILQGSYSQICQLEPVTYKGLF